MKVLRDSLFAMFMIATGLIIVWAIWFYLKEKIFIKKEK